MVTQLTFARSDSTKETEKDVKYFQVNNKDLSVFIVSFEYISPFFRVFLLLTLSR